MKKLLILSGKGGTGKTTTAAAFIHFSGADTIVDCDVDAPNLHLVTEAAAEPERSAFYGGDKAVVDRDACQGCGKCVEACRFGALRLADGTCQVLEHACEGCGVCAYVCPEHAIQLRQDEAGALSLYRGKRVFSTATLKMGRGNSGKLVTAVKLAAAKAAPKAELTIIDGSPGIGCPVIASVSGVDLVLIVAEPSLSGLSDLQRILKTASILQAHVAVCINKWDASPEKTAELEAFCREQQVPVVGKIPYDQRASEAINAGVSIAAYDCPARDALYAAYENTMTLLHRVEKTSVQSSSLS